MPYWAKPLYLTPEDIASGRRVFLPPHGYKFNKVILMGEGTDKPYGWYDNKQYEINDEGEHVLLQNLDEGSPIMLFRPKVLIDTSGHYKNTEKTNKILFPQVEAYSIHGTEPKLEISVVNDISEEPAPKDEEGNEQEKFHGYSKVTTIIKWNEEDFPIKWLEQKEYILNLDTDENGIQIDDQWKEIPIKGADNIYYCGIKMNILVRIQITAINKERLDKFKFSILGGEILAPGETGLFIRRTLDFDASPYEYQIKAIYNNTNEHKVTFEPASQTFHGILDRSDGFKIKIRSGIDKDMIEFTGDDSALDPKAKLPMMTCTLSAKMFSMKFGNDWKPDDDDNK